MARLKSVLFCLVALAAVGAIASASALAAGHEYVEEKCEENAAGTLTKYTTQVKCEKKESPGSGAWQHIELASSEVEGESPAGETAELAGTIASAKIVVGCAKTKIAAGTGFVEREGKSKATIEYSECSLYSGTTGKKFPLCTVPNITAKVKDLLLGSPVEDTFEPETGTTFAEIEVKGAECTEKITKEPVTGTQECELPEAGEFKVLHIIHCLATGSTLKFDGSTATYSGLISIKLHSAVPWAAL
jgi:hypothetical protein